jgi:hypothetical protein
LFIKADKARAREDDVMDRSVYLFAILILILIGFPFLNFLAFVLAPFGSRADLCVATLLVSSTYPVLLHTTACEAFVSSSGTYRGSRKKISYGHRS